MTDAFIISMTAKYVLMKKTLKYANMQYAKRI